MSNFIDEWLAEKIKKRFDQENLRVYYEEIKRTAKMYNYENNFDHGGVVPPDGHYYKSPDGGLKLPWNYAARIAAARPEEVISIE